METGLKIQRKFDSKKEIEKEKIEKLLAGMPEEIREEAEGLLTELHQQETETAKFAKECDKLETLLQAESYSEILGENHLEEFLESYRNYFQTETGKEIFHQLQDKSKNIEDHQLIRYLHEKVSINEVPE